MRLIDADKLQERMKKGVESGSNLNITYSLYIKQAPTIEINDSISRSGAVEGVKELFACADSGNDECDITYMLENLPSADRPTGEWVKRDFLNQRAYYICSLCGRNGNDYDNYCPNCGAKMKGKK